MQRQAIERFDSDPQAEQNLVSAIADIARAALNRQEPFAFKLAEAEVRRRLSRVLSSLGDTEYLTPIVDMSTTQSLGVDMITQNYDLAVEEAASSRDIPVHRGFSSWRPDVSLELPERDGALNLYKVHGSIDWRADFTGSTNFAYPPPQIYAGDFAATEDPWIVIGDREKLSTDGPTLDLMNAARTALDGANHLVVIGPSYSDDPINGMIRKWLMGREARWLTTLDPAFANSERPSRFLETMSRYVRFAERSRCDAPNYSSSVERKDWAATSTGGPTE